MLTTATWNIKKLLTYRKVKSPDTEFQVRFGVKMLILATTEDSNMMPVHIYCCMVAWVIYLFVLTLHFPIFLL